MTGRLGVPFPRTMVVVLITMVIILAEQGAQGVRYRFASTSASQGSCIFPCRCTRGCDVTTGHCINGGRCEDGQPSGYLWGGTACQTGNVGYKKTASQSHRMIGEKWSTTYPAGLALDGNTDPNFNHSSCAHPTAPEGTDASWMVDLGGTYKISRVAIYNRMSVSSAKRLDTFTLSVGNSQDSLTQCASHTGSVPASGHVSTPCRAVGRYLRFKRNGGYTRHLTSICEVVINGHLYIDCQQSSCSSVCNDATGCDTCVPGRQQPNCKTACEDRTYGVNCQNDCGHCKDNSVCDVVSGICTTGCDDWYITDVCKALISLPYYRILQIPKVDATTRSTAVLSWPKANGIPPGLEFYYYYEVWLHADGEVERKVVHVPQGAGVDRLVSRITGLVCDTKYSVKVEPYRQHNTTYEGGTATGFVTVQTNCEEQVMTISTELDRPITTSLPKSTSNIAVNCPTAALETGSWIVVSVSMFLLGLVVATVLTLLVIRSGSVMATNVAEEPHRERRSTGTVPAAVTDDQVYVNVRKKTDKQAVITDGQVYLNVPKKTDKQAVVTDDQVYLNVPKKTDKQGGANEGESGYVHTARDHKNKANVYAVIHRSS